MDECDSCGTVSRTVALYEFALGPEWEDYGKQYMWCPGCKDDDYIKVVIKEE